MDIFRCYLKWVLLIAGLFNLTHFFYLLWYEGFDLDKFTIALLMLALFLEYMMEPLKYKSPAG